MKVAVVSEFYPRADDPVLGVWAHRQALAVRDAGADVRVVVLHRIVPPAATAAHRLPAATIRLARHPRRLRLDGLDVRYVRYASPPRWRSYGSWGAWAAPALGRALRSLRQRLRLRPRPCPQRRAGRRRRPANRRAGAAGDLRARSRRLPHRRPARERTGGDRARVRRGATRPREQRRYRRGR